MPHEPKVGELPAQYVTLKQVADQFAGMLPTKHYRAAMANLEAAAEREARKDEARDAARYRWLREQEWFSSPLAVLSDPKRVLTSGSGLGAYCPSGDRLDAAIDARIAEQPESP